MTSSSLRCLAAVSCAFVAFAASARGATTVEEGFALERLRPATTSRGVNDVEWGGVGEHGQWNTSLWLHYANDPLAVYVDGARAGALVAHRVAGDLAVSVAFFDWAELAAQLPVVAFQSADSEGLPPSVSGFTTAAAGVGDLRLVPKLRLLRAAEQLVDLAVIPAVTLPTAQPSGRAWMGENGPTFVPELAVSRALGALRLAGNAAWRARLTTRTARNLTLGSELVVRAGVGLQLDEFIAVPVTVDASLSGATSASAPLSSGVGDNPLEFLLSARHDLLHVPASRGAGDDVIVQGFVGGGAGLVGGVGTPDFRVLAGVRVFAPTDVDHDDDGIVDSADSCPAVAEDNDGFDDVDGCVDADNDKDDLADAADQCTNDAEDRDGFADADGCPDADNDADAVRDRDDGCPDEKGPGENRGCPWPDGDNDGVLDKDDACPVVAGVPALVGCPDADVDGLTDAEDRCPALAGPKTPYRGCPDTDRDGFTDDVDRCPAAAETVNNVTDDDGCPDEGRVLVSLTAQKIEILDKVFFDSGNATIKERSFALLDQVATVMKSHVELTRVRIEGHTDDKADDDKNKALSQERADAVKAYLVGKGVDAARLDAVGFGGAQPAADNATAAGREKNRRVEFVLVPYSGGDLH
jgi:outer membrane protein OmpA-like peptidoglycan-associated protein